MLNVEVCTYVVGIEEITVSTSLLALLAALALELAVIAADLTIATEPFKR